MSKGIWIACLAAGIWSGAASAATGLVLKTVIPDVGRPLVSGNVIAVESGKGTLIWESDASGNWNHTATLPISDTDAVALSGDTVLLGNSSPAYWGPARVYTKQASGAWIETAQLTDSTGNTCDFFG